MRFLTAGESHGKALVGILEGVPSGLKISKEEIHLELIRRKKGFGRGDRQRIEDDKVEILSGVRHGVTLGSPIALMIVNKDFENWSNTMSSEPNSNSDREVLVPRPGHADYVGALKYNFEDMRNVLERASARETTMRVAIAAICKKFLRELGIDIMSRVYSIGTVEDITALPDSFDPVVFAKIEASRVRCVSSDIEHQMIAQVEEAAKEGDTLGGVFEVVAYNVLPCLGSYTHWDRRIEGKLAQSLMSLNAIKGVEVGLGFEMAKRMGSQVHDHIIVKSSQLTYATNRAGGVTGGMTTGLPLVLRAGMKPLSTLKKPLNSINTKTLTEEKAHYERADVCAVPAAAVIAESLCALVLMEEILEKFGGDSMAEILPRIESWKSKARVT